MGRQKCSGYISLTSHVNTKDGGSTASETLVCGHETTRLKTPEPRLLELCMFV